MGLVDGVRWEGSVCEVGGEEGSVFDYTYMYLYW